MNKTLAIASVLMAAALTGIISTTTAYADESETNTENKIKQNNVGSGSSTNVQCAENNIDSGEDGQNGLVRLPPLDLQLCGTADVSVAAP